MLIRGIRTTSTGHVAIYLVVDTSSPTVQVATASDSGSTCSPPPRIASNSLLIDSSSLCNLDIDVGTSSVSTSCLCCCSRIAPAIHSSVALPSNKTSFRDTTSISCQQRIEPILTRKLTANNEFHACNHLRHPSVLGVRRSGLILVWASTQATSMWLHKHYQQNQRCLKI